MKFRSNDKVFIYNKLNGIEIIVGPILDRNNRVWKKYIIYTKIKYKFEDLVKKYKTSFDDNNIIVIKYSEFKRVLKIDYIKEINNFKIIMSEQDYLNDLKFMNDELIKCKNNEKRYRENGNNNLAKFYYNLINKNQYRMFQFNDKETYNKYLKHIDDIIKEKQKEKIEKFSLLYQNIW